MNQDINRTFFRLDKNVGVAENAPVSGGICKRSLGLLDESGHNQDITRIHLANIGPARDLEAEFGEGLNLITGDNGLGKTFRGWWAMRIADGQVDHFLSKKNHRRLTYSWGNCRSEISVSE